MSRLSRDLHSWEGHCWYKAKFESCWCRFGRGRRAAWKREIDAALSALLEGETIFDSKVTELRGLTGNKLPWLNIHPADSPGGHLGVVPLRGPAQEPLCFTYSVCGTVTEFEGQTQVTGKKAGLENSSSVLGCCLIPLV